MASRLKEDEKNEKIIRGLQKQPANKKCINCNSLGPQYVCTTFSTFVCTTCSGIHREFTHRIKSVSMAKFTPQEVSSLQAGGNECAKEIYFKELDMHRAPDSSNVDRLRDFIKRVYVDRRFMGEKSSDRPPRFKLGEGKESNVSKRSDGYQSGSRSPPYDDGYERRFSDRPSPRYDGRRSPGYDQDGQRHNDFGRSPVHSGVVNDWRREDGFANGGRSEYCKSSDGDSKIEGKSPDRQKDLTVSSPPAARPVRDILGDNAALPDSESQMSSTVRVGDGSAHAQRADVSNNLVCGSEHQTELKKENSLIDFDTYPAPPAPAVGVQTQQSTANQSSAQSKVASNDNNWACFDNNPVEAKASQVPSKPNLLESLLSQLSVPAPAPAPATAIGVPGTGGTTTLEPPNNVSSSGFSIDSLFGSVGPMSMASSNVPPPAAPGAASNASLFPPGGAPAPGAASTTSFFPPAGYGTPANNAPFFSPASNPAPVPANNTSFFPAAGNPAPAPVNNTSFFSPGNPVLTPASSSSFFTPADAPTAARESKESSSAARGMTPSFPVTGANGQWPGVQQQKQSLFPNARSPQVTSSFGGVPMSMGPSSNPAAHAPQDVASLAQASYGAGGQPAYAKSGERKELPADLFASTYSPVLAPVYGWQPGLAPGMGLQMQYNNAMSLPSFQQPAKSANPFDVGREGSPIQAATFPSMAPLPAALPNMAAPKGVMHAGVPSWIPHQSSSHPGLLPQMAQQVPSNMTPSWPQGYGGFGNEGSTFGTQNPNLNLSGRFPASSLHRTAGGNPFG